MTTQSQAIANTQTSADTPSLRSMELARNALDGGEWLLGETILRVAIALDTVRAEVIAEFAGDLVSQFAAVRAEERERCARIAERHWHVQASVDIADLIRGIGDEVVSKSLKGAT